MYGDDALGHLIKFIPIKEMRRITLKWPKLPPVKDLWECDPFRFIGYAVGHEGKNSLLSELIRQDLAVSLSSSNQPRLQETWSQFKIDITLTEKGMKEYEEVIRLVFAYLNKLIE